MLATLPLIDMLPVPSAGATVVVLWEALLRPRLELLWVGLLWLVTFPLVRVKLVPWAGTVTAAAAGLSSS